MADWEEIKRLAADFQRVQLSSSSFKLSERNCIELVQKLVELKLIEIIYTLDGKEYLTPQELIKEIKEELIAHNGRINLVDLQSALNVDFSIIEAKVNEIVKHDKKLFLITGQLISSDYIDVLSEEINDLLQEKGQLTVVHITKQYDLPVQFVSDVFMQRVGSIIKGKIDDSDNDTIFTESFVARHEAKICGYFSSLTKPTKVSQFIISNAVPEHLFFKIVEKLIYSCRIQGSLSGHSKDKAIFIPAIYTKAQNNWIDNFLLQNGYLEYDSLARIGISDAKNFIKKRFKNDSLHYLQSCAIGQSLLERVESEVEEAVASKSWVDISSILPSILSTFDINELLLKVLKSSTDTAIIANTIVVSKDFLSSCLDMFDSIMKSKAADNLKENLPGILKSCGPKSFKDEADETSEKSSKKDQRKKKAVSGKSSTGGTMGREMKTKSLKKKNKQRDIKDDSDDEDSSNVIEFLSALEIQAEFSKSDVFNECTEDFMFELAEFIEQPLQQKFKEILTEMLKNMTNNVSKKNMVDIEGKLNDLFADFKLYAKGINIYGEDTKVLEQHLLKTVGNDMVNILFQIVADENMLSVGDPMHITLEVRQRILSKLPDDDVKSALLTVHSSLIEKSVDEFVQKFENTCSSQVMSILLKKIDKKKEKQLILNNRQLLIEKLNSESSLSLGLHIACVLIFTINTQCILHIPGRCVPNLITFLKKYLTDEHHQKLLVCQEHVVKTMIQHSEENSSSSSNGESLLSDLKSMVLHIQKSMK